MKASFRRITGLVNCSRFGTFIVEDVLWGYGKRALTIVLIRYDLPRN